MASYTGIVLESPLTAAQFKSVCDLAPGQLPALNNLLDYLGAAAGGNQSASLTFNVGAVYATAAITSTGTATAAQTMTLANITLTAIAPGTPAENEFVVSATVGTQAANIAACINASTDLAGIVTATSLAGVVTVTSVVPGAIGNGLQIVDVNLGNVTVAAFSGGLDGTAYTLDFL
jgi:hypothetical protein